MIKRTTSCLLSILICLVGVAMPMNSTAWAQEVTQADIDRTIDELQKYLYSKQDPEDGAWYGKYHKKGDDPIKNKNVGGPTAIATLALLSSGESMQDPRIAKSLEWLAEAEMMGTYALSLRAHCWSYLPGDFLPLLERDASSLLESTGALSKFNYYVYPHPNITGGGEFGSGSRGRVIKRTDNSTTQYGILAIWQAAKRGAKISDKFWENAVVHFLEEQNEDGGWTYGANGTSRPTMTCAGLTVLYVAQQELLRDKDIADPNLQAVIDRGLAYMDKRFKDPGSVHGGVGYYYYGVERVGLASGRKYMGGEDWFKSIASKIVHERRGDSLVNRSFELMFLARGNVPIWINKLEIPGYAWRNRPNDIYFLNSYMSTYRERDLGWQIVSIEEDSTRWLNAPILYLSGRDDLELTDTQVANLKQYLDLGGVLWANPERGSSQFQASIEALAKRMYPELPEMENVPAGHPLSQLIQPVGSPTARLRVKSLNNGVRDLILMPSEDWGMAWQRDENPGSTDPWKVAINLYAMASERGVMHPRLETPFEPRTEATAKGSISVAWVVPEGQGNLESEAYTLLGNTLFNATQMSLDVKVMTPAELATAADVGFAHLAGTDATTLPDSELEALVAFVNGGGTLLVENLGGRSGFIDQIEPRLASLMGTSTQRLVRPVITTASGLEGGEPVNRILLRPYSVLTRGSSSGLTMSQFKVDNRPGILLSRQDLTLGMMGIRQWGIDGYAPETARTLMQNLVLYAQQQRGAAVVE